MISANWVWPLLIAVSLDEPTDETAKSLAAKKAAQHLVAATNKGDYGTLIDYTYDTAVKEMGGREKAIKAIERLMKEMKEEGFTIKSYEIDKPGKYLVEGDNGFVLLPTKMEMTSSGGGIALKSYLLGISSDQGKNWKFINGDAKLHIESYRKKILPKLPAKLKLPAPQAPEFIPEE